MTPVEFYTDVVLPALFERVSAAFPEFGFELRGQRWVATAKDGAGHGPLGTRADRVVVRRLKDGSLPEGFAVAGADSVPFLGYVLGRDSYPRGEDWKRAVAMLAQRAGVDDGPLRGARETPDDVQRREGLRRRNDEMRAAAAAREAEEQRRRVRRAAQLWREAEPGHAMIVAYIESRGVRVADLPGGVIPPTLRFHPACPLRDESGRRCEPGAAMLGAIATGRSLIGVQRIALNDDGTRRSNVPKLSLGLVAGGAVRLGGDYGDGLLLLTEGIETGLACLAATGTATWACVSTGGLRSIDLPERLVADRGVRRVIVMADLDDVDVHTGERPGSAAAIACCERIGRLWPGVEAAIAAPTHCAAPDLVGADGGVV